jgi:hypothetical protein
MSGFLLPINSTPTDINLGEDWKSRRDVMAREHDARLIKHWAIDLATWVSSGFGGLNISGFGGPVVDANGTPTTAAAWGPIALTNNATNYVERTHAGVVSANVAGFTPDTSLPLYVIVTSAGAVTTITDYRVLAAIPSHSASLKAIRALTPAASKVPYFTSASAAALADLDVDGTLAADSDTRLATQKAVKTYVDAQVAGLSWKQQVRAATTAAGVLATDFENGDTLDGVVLATGNRILIKNQAAGAENGIYVVAASGAPTRATDADAGAELVNATVYVSEGTANADTQWTCTTNATITVGTTSLVFAQITGTGGGVTSVLGQTGAVTFAVPIAFIIDGGGSAITTGIKGDLEVPFAGTITGWTLLADQSGDIVIDTWKDSYANFPPTIADTMWGTKPALSAASKNQATGLSIAVTAGQIIRFNVDSAATITRATLSFTMTRTS